MVETAEALKNNLKITRSIPTRGPRAKLGEN